MTNVVLTRMGTSVDPHMFEALFTQQVLIFLFDGLDEITDQLEQRWLIDTIEDIAQSGNSILVTSRQVDYEFYLRGFTRATIQNLDSEQIRGFLERWYAHVLSPSTRSSEDLRGLEALYTILTNDPRLQMLASNPLLLTVITSLHRHERLPARRVHVYDRCVDLLLWPRQRGTNKLWQDIQMTKDVQWACVAHLGFVLHERGQQAVADNTATLKYMQQEVERCLESRRLFSRDERAREASLFLELLRLETELIIKQAVNEQGEGLYGFSHLTFQQYFAALDVYYRQADPSFLDQSEDSHTILGQFLARHLHDPYWQEVIFLLLGKLGPVRTTPLLQQIVQEGTHPGRNAEEEQKDLFFVCSCLAEEIPIQNKLAVTVVSHLKSLAEHAPSHSAAAIGALGTLLQTQQYGNLAQVELLALTHSSNLSLTHRAQAIQSLYQDSTLDSQKRQQVVNALREITGLSATQVQDLFLSFEGKNREVIAERILQVLQTNIRIAQRRQYLYLERPQLSAIQVGQELPFVLHFTSDERPHCIPFTIPINALEVAVYVETTGFHVVDEHVYSLPVIEGYLAQPQLPFKLIPVTSGELTVRLLIYPGGRVKGLEPAVLTDTVQVAAPVTLPNIPELIDRRMLPDPLPDVILYVSLEERPEVQRLQVHITCSALGLDRKPLEPLALTEDDITWLRQSAVQCAAESTNAAPTDILMSMQALGAFLFDQLLPRRHPLRNLYWHMRHLARLSSTPWSWLVISDERAILPWELICPYERPPGTNTPWYDNFLAETFVLAHWVGRQGLTLMNEAPLGWLALDHYHQRPLELPFWHQVLADEVPEGREEMIGHVALMQAGSPYYGLHVLRYIDQHQSGQVTARDDQMLASTTVHNEAEAMLYQHRLDFTLHRPVCGLSFVDGQGDRKELLLSQYDVHLEVGWLLPFMHAGASALVGARWPVQPESDQLFFRTFYQAMRSGTPLGWAVAEARARVKRTHPYRVDWLAYTYFGHPWCQPYLVQEAQGFALFETLDHPDDTPFEAGQTYQFRASYRAEAPLWYDGRLQLQQMPLQGEGVSVLVMPLIGVMPETYSLQPAPASDDYQYIIALTMPQEEMTLPVLVRFQRGKQELQTLIVNLDVSKKGSRV